MVVGPLGGYMKIADCTASKHCCTANAVSLLAAINDHHTLQLFNSIKKHLEHNLTFSSTGREPDIDRSDLIGTFPYIEQDFVDVAEFVIDDGESEIVWQNSVKESTRDDQQNWGFYNNFQSKLKLKWQSVLCNTQKIDWMRPTKTSHTQAVTRAELAKRQADREAAKNVPIDVAVVALLLNIITTTQRAFVSVPSLLTTGSC